MTTLAQRIEKRAAIWALGLSVLMLVADFITGPYVSFPIMFIFPVAIMAWYRPCRWAIALATLLCLVRLSFSVHWHSTTNIDFSISILNTIIRMIVLSLVAVLISRVVRQKRALEARVKTLEGILPVCGYCKKIRNEEEVWEQMESYVGRHSEARFSHSVCPDCGKLHYPLYFPEDSQPSVPTAAK